MRVKVQDLAPSCLTRHRGNQAYQTLLKMDDGSQIEVELDGAEILSLSFLDELVFRVNQTGAGDRLVLVSENPDHIGKLARISGFRGVTIRRMSNGRPEPIPPERSSAPEAVAFAGRPPE